MTFPVLLAYPRVYRWLMTSKRRDDFETVFAKCYELALNRPPIEDRHGGFFGMGGIGDDRQLALFTVWSSEKGKPDIFIIAGRGDGFGPGDTCPSKQELRDGMYGDLMQISLA